jgi:IMP dehydrogenase/GMP reductase
MRSGGKVSVRSEIVKFSGALVPVVAACSACCAAAAFVAALIAHGLFLSWMKRNCITLSFGRM